MRIDHSVRIDPADKKGIHIVQNEGGEQVYILKKQIPQLINNLKEVLKQ